MSRQPWLRGFHHYYTGLLMMLAAFVWAGFAGSFLLSGILAAAGLIVAADDFYQHWRHTKEGNTSYASPVHRLYAVTLYRIPFIRKLNEWADKNIFGGK